MDTAGGEQDLFRYCGFAGVDVGDKPNIADLFNGESGFRLGYHETGHRILTMKTGRWGLLGINW